MKLTLGVLLTGALLLANGCCASVYRPACAPTCETETYVETPVCYERPVYVQRPVYVERPVYVAPRCAPRVTYVAPVRTTYVAARPATYSSHHSSGHFTGHSLHHHD